jgi:hypothetical protein
MLNKEPKGFITAEIALTSACPDAVSANRSSSPFVGPNRTDGDRGRVSIVTPDHGPPAADHLAELVSSTMPDATDAVIRDFDCTPSEDGGIRTARREYTFVSSGAHLSTPDA